VAGNKLRGRYLARGWRVLDKGVTNVETCHNGGSCKAAICLIDVKIRCVTCGRCRRRAALSGTRLDAVD